MKTISIHSIFFTTFFINLFSIAWGQNYQSVHYDREAYFESEHFGIHPDGGSACGPCRLGIRVQEVLPDSNQFVFPTYWQSLDFPATPRPSWLGDTLQILSDGTELFHNKDGVLITLKPQTELLGTWNVFELPDDAYFEAIVSAITYDEILGQMDSVKTISFQAKDSAGMNISHEMNDSTIEISQNLGFVKACDIYHFPEVKEPILLIGLTDPDLGEPLLNTRTIFDFNIGDERHYVDDHWFEATDYSRWIVLNREDITPDSVVYTFDRYRVHKYGYDDDNGVYVIVYSKQRDTLFQSYKLDGYNYFDSHPYEAVPNTNNFIFSYIWKDWDGFWVKEINNDPGNVSSNWYSHYQTCLGPTKRHSNASGGVEWHEELVY